MFFFKYLRRELRRRMRQAIFIGLGLALGVGLVITVSAASAGVKKAQTKVLSALYGVGTDVTVTGAAPGPPTGGGFGGGGGGGGSGSGGQRQITFGPGGAQICTNGTCSNVAGQTIENVNPTAGTMSSSKVTAVAALHDVSAAAGGLTLLDTTITFGQSTGSGNSFAPPTPNSVTIDGVDLAHTSLGPLSNATLTSGHAFASSDTNSNVALVDSSYASSNSLKVGLTVTLNSVAYNVIGIVSQPSSSNPPDVYIPLAEAQAFTSQRSGSLAGEVNTIYVTAKSSADISAVQKEISDVLPGTTVTTASSLAKQVTGSVSSAATLANDLGKWLSVVGLIAAFALATLL
ncbi:MAG: ABC transporter permease, partial [Acidimicrobiales bacterium]